MSEQNTMSRVIARALSDAEESHLASIGLHRCSECPDCPDDMRVAAVLSALDAAGYVIVPKEPTQEMIEAGWAAAHDESAAECWRDMLAASQQCQKAHAPNTATVAAIAEIEAGGGSGVADLNAPDPKCCNGFSLIDCARTPDRHCDGYDAASQQKGG